MSALLSDPVVLAVVFTICAFALMGSITLAGLMRALRRERARTLHRLTAVQGAIGLVILALVTLGIDTGLGIILGLIAGFGAVLFWLIGALVTRARPAWVDLLVIVSTLAFLASYSLMAEGAGNGPAVFPGITITGPAAPRP